MSFEANYGLSPAVHGPGCGGWSRGRVVWSFCELLLVKGAWIEVPLCGSRLMSLIEAKLMKKSIS